MFLTIDYSDSITTENNLIITNGNQNTNLTIDSCDLITNEYQNTYLTNRFLWFNNNMKTKIAYLTIDND